MEGKGRPFWTLRKWTCEADAEVPIYVNIFQHLCIDTHIYIYFQMINDFFGRVQ